MVEPAEGRMSPERINQERLTLTKVSNKFDMFQKGAHDLFAELRDFVKNEFTVRLNKMEEKVDLSPDYLDSLLSLKECLLEVQ